MDDTKLTEYIRESNAIEDIYGEAEIEQSLVAWLILNGHMEPLTHGIITKVQKVITLHQNDLMPHQRGYYRDMSKTNVQIGGRYAPMWHMVPMRMPRCLCRSCEHGLYALLLGTPRPCWASVCYRE
jgi:hypothetical protein